MGDERGLIVWSRVWDIEVAFLGIVTVHLHITSTLFRIILKKM